MRIKENMNTIDFEQYLCPIAYYPHKQLREKCVAVPEGLFGTSHLDEQIKAMYTTMKYHNGVGIAACQIIYKFKTGHPNRVIVVDVDGNKHVIINPIFIHKEGEYTTDEGCLSLPGYFHNITRAKNISFIYRTIDGEHIQATATDLLAASIQHECDHLDGKLFIDDLSFLKRKMAESKVRKTIKQMERNKKNDK